MKDNIPPTSIAIALTDNIGDDVQSLALAGLINGPVRAYPRDNIAAISKEIPNGILSGWLSRNSRPFDGKWLAGKLTPLSFYLCNEYHFQSHWFDYFKNSEAVITRDIATRDKLREKGIAAEFGGCFSLFSARSISFPAIADVPYTFCTEDNQLYDLAQSGHSTIIYSSPIWLPMISRLDIKARFSVCLFWLWLINNAKNIYTNRLHVALPAISYGTNLYFNKYNQTIINQGAARTSGFKDILIGKQAQEGAIELDTINHITSQLQQNCKKIEPLSFNQRPALSIKERYIELLDKMNITFSADEIDAGFKRGAYIFSHMIRIYRKNKDSVLPEVVTIARSLGAQYVATWIPENIRSEFGNYEKEFYLRGDFNPFTKTKPPVK